MTRRNVLILGGLALLVILPVAWYLGSPLFLDRTVEEAFPLEIPSEVELAEMPEEERDQLEAQMMATAAAEPDKALQEDMPAGQPVAAARGSFAGADDFHRGSGEATIYELPDGSAVLRFEDFSVTNGPDLHVILSFSSPAPKDRATLGEDYVDLGPLKGNMGSQNYEIPAGVDLEQVQSVVIYCMPFHVVFSTAALAPG
jgi:hypothetical protein